MPSPSKSDLEDVNTTIQFNYCKPTNIKDVEQDQQYQPQTINTKTEEGKLLQTAQIDILDSIDTTQPHVHDDNNKQSESHVDVKKHSKKVIFDYEQAITIEYNEHDLITRLTVFDVDYMQIKFKPKVVKNYKTISKVGLKPCISTEFTKHLKLHTITVLKLLNIANVHKKTIYNNSSNSNSSRTTFIKRITNMKNKRTNTSVDRSYKRNNIIKKGSNSLNTSMNKHRYKVLRIRM